MQRRLLWRRWLGYVTAGELGGFAVPAAVAAWSMGAAAGAQVGWMVAAGLVEGGVLGLAQATVLRRELPTLDRRVWVVATSLAAGFAWLLGMLPSATHGVWSSWPDAVTVVAGVLAGVLLLGSIGTAQALVLPAGTARRWSWAGWTALGWCAGLIAFSVVAPPLWHEGQSAGATIAIGLVGGVVMAAVMAGVTGVGMVRLVTRSAAVLPPAGSSGPYLASTVLGAEAYDAEGHLLGRIADLVVDLAAGPDRAPLTDVLVRTPDRRRVLVAPRWAGRAAVGGGWVLADPRSSPERPLTQTELMIDRDVLDSPVITASPPRRARVSDVVVELGPLGGVLVGLDLSPGGALRRLLGRAALPSRHSVVPLAEAHLASGRGHRAQLRAPGTLVHGLSADAMAEVLTRASVGHARDIVRAADREVADRAVQLLHPDVRDRVTGRATPRRRLLRLGGWRLHRPATHRHGGGGA